MEYRIRRRNGTRNRVSIFEFVPSLPPIGEGELIVESDRWDYALNGRFVGLEEQGIELDCEVSNIKWQIIIEVKDSYFPIHAIKLTRQGGRTNFTTFLNQKYTVFTSQNLVTFRVSPCFAAFHKYASNCPAVISFINGFPSDIFLAR
jgi:hypothetical protein